MTSADSKKMCPLLNKVIRRGYCYEIGDVLRDDMDIEHLEDEFDIEEAKEICSKCGWDNTTIE